MPVNRPASTDEVPGVVERAWGRLQPHAGVISRVSAGTEVGDARVAVYADPHRCPGCRGLLPTTTSVCPSCGLRLEGPLTVELFATLSRADELVEQMRSAARGTDVSETTSTQTGDEPLRESAAPDEPAELTRPAAPRLREPLLKRAAPAEPAEPTRPATPRLREPQDATAAPPRTGLSSASVPTILLGLGALCLLVAALVFLAVAWSTMGVGGRTATLVGLTLVAGAFTAWSARRSLRATVESLGVVTLGLLAFDLVGARDAGWLGDVGTPGLLMVLGMVLLAAGAGATLLLRRSPVGSFSGGQLVAVVGLVAAAAGVLTSDAVSWSLGTTLAALGAWAVAGAAFRGRLKGLAAGAGLAGLLLGALQVVSSVDRALAHPSFRALWWELEVWPLAVSVVPLVALGMVRHLPERMRQAAAALAGVLVAGIVLVPVSDEPATLAALAGAGLVVVLLGLVLLLPPGPRPGAVAPVVLLTLWMLQLTLELAAGAATRLLTAGEPVWSGAVGTVLEPPPSSDRTLAAWVLPLVVLAAGAGLLALARGSRRAAGVLRPLARPDVLVAVVTATVVLGLTAYAVPLWLPLTLLLLSGGLLVARAVLSGSSVPLVLGAVLLSGGLLVSLHSEGLSLIAVSVGVLTAFTVHLRGPAGAGAASAGAVIGLLTAGLVWTGGALLDTWQQWTALVALLALTGLVLLLPHVRTPVRAAGPAWTTGGLEVGVLLAVPVVSVAGVTAAEGGASGSTWAAVYLTVAGATASAMALTRADRRRVGWLGGVLLAMASWVRLADRGVDTVEAYTLPSALVLVVVGVIHLHRRADSGTMTALTPGLLLGLAPTLLAAIADPISLRSLLLGAVCVGLLVAGLRLHWAAPVLHGALAGALLVIRLASPVAEAVPRWALIGVVGGVLIAAGITWEQRLRQARAVAGYVRRLR